MDSSDNEPSDKDNEDEVVVAATEEAVADKSTEDVEDCVQLEDEILNLLGADDSKAVSEFKFHPELAKQWTRVLSKGLAKETKLELLDAYPRKGNCQILTPKLNPEIETAVNDAVKKRDKYLFMDQELCGASLSSLGGAIDLILNSDENGIVKNELLKSLIDSGKLMCELFNQLTKARKAFIYPGLERKARSLLGNASTDDMLFGSELPQRIKTAKEVEKVGFALKSQAPERKVFSRPQAFLNWKRPPVKASIQSQVGYRRRVHPGMSQSVGNQGKYRMSGRQPLVRQAMSVYNTKQ